jgi:exodeoxyribonuclease VII large subunit
LPVQVGVITSPTGAALRDVLHVLERRFPALPVVLYPAQVQGDEAPAALRAALAAAVRRAECDVLIVARGGGSLEDLWAFNDEALVRDLAACPIPVVSGVGHETDVTLVDLVADLRAPTPSAAAEAVSPDGAALAHRFAEFAAHLATRQRRALATRGERLGWLLRRLALRHPEQRLRERSQRVDELERRLRDAWNRYAERRGHRLVVAERTLARHHPGPALAAQQATLAALGHRLGVAMRHAFATRRQVCATLGRGLDLVSPLATLGRGYAIVNGPDGRILRRAGEVEVGARVTARLASGRLGCVVASIAAEEDPDAAVPPTS